MAKETKSKFITEDIPDKDNINRWAIFAKHGFIPSHVELLLSFKHGSAESCNWEKYLSDMTKIHKEGTKLASQRTKNKNIEHDYYGYSRYNSGKLREIKPPLDAKNAFLKIDHVPNDENRAHSHVSIEGFKPLKLSQLASYFAQRIEGNRIEFIKYSG